MLITKSNADFSIYVFYFELSLGKNLCAILIVLVLMLWLMNNNILIQIRQNVLLPQLYIQLRGVFSLVVFLVLERYIQNLSLTVTVLSCTDTMTGFYHP